MAGKRTLGRLVVLLTANTSDFVTKMGAAGEIANRVGKKMTSVGKSISTYLTLPIAGATAAFTKMAADFEEKMNKIQALVGISKEDMKAAKFEDGIFQVSRETAIGATELGEALFFLTSNGLRGADAMEALRWSARAAAAGLGETKEIAKTLAGAIVAYGASVEDIQGYVDVLVKTVELGQMEATELASAFGPIIDTSANLKVPMEDAGAAIAVMTRRAMPAAEAATKLNAIMRSFTKPLPKVNEAFKKIGMESQAFASRLVAEKGLLAVLLQVKKEAKYAGLTLADFFPRAEAFQGALALVGSGVQDTIDVFANMNGQFKEFNGRIHKATEGAGYMGKTMEAFLIAQDKANMKWAQFKAAIEELMITIGKDLLPIAKEALEWMTAKIHELTDYWNGLNLEAKKYHMKWVLILAAVGPVLVAVGLALKLFGMLATILGALGTAFSVVAAIVGTTAATIGLIGVAITAVLGLMYYFREEMGELGAEFIGWLISMEPTIQGWLKSMKDAIIDFFAGIPSVAKKILSSIKDFAAGVWGWVVESLASVGKFTLEIRDKIVSALITLFTRWSTFYDTAATAVSNFVENVKSGWNRLTVAIAGYASKILAIVKKVAAAFASIGIKSFASKVGGKIGDVVGAIKSQFQTSVDAAKNWFFGSPKLARGGDVLRGGTALVGERGPELLNLPRGASVSPLGGGAGGQTILVQLDSKTIAKAAASGMPQVLKVKTGFRGSF